MGYVIDSRNGNSLPGSVMFLPKQAIEGFPIDADWIALSTNQINAR